jgi:predicted dehydrogenase
VKQLINVALIGVGYWGPNLLRNLVANNDCKVSAVVDLASDRRKYVNNQYPGIEVTDQIEDILNNASIDAVVIATPAATHFDLVTKALKSGKHVLVEKPMAMTIEEVEKIDSLSKENNLVAMVGHTFLYNSAVRYLKEYIESGKLGDIRYIFSQRVNLGRIRSDVDVTWNLAPHDISIIQYLLGNPTPVSIIQQGMDYVQEGINDVAFLNIVYPNKIMAHIHVSWLDPHKIRRMTVVGSKKMVVYDDIAENKIAIYDKGIDRMAILGENMDFDDPRNFTFNLRSGDVYLPKIHFEEPLKVEIEHFLDCIQNKTKCLTGCEHAKKVIEVLSA